jgi:hypothetical protein
MKIKNRTRLVQIFGHFACLTVLMYASGCASLPLFGGIAPKAIIVRNNSGTGLSQVDIFEITKPAGGGGRFGSISPVPEGASQILVRGDSAPPLPAVLGVRWADNRGREFHGQVSLRQLQTKSDGHSEEALVFEILQSGHVHAYLEPHQRVNSP